MASFTFAHDPFVFTGKITLHSSVTDQMVLGQLTFRTFLQGTNTSTLKQSPRSFSEIAQTS
ncbi:hypothetical protein OS493_001799 [Desmophyllum pertusum]|uniref:Uncharacterized protein n=1 Tax=Desmophyllum pertusum TaxID=174260 RepID=A0A9W9Z4T9_9CNID|nr:hypothetical protein OS493_001799 [Desmophyllum pertusum]